MRAFENSQVRTNYLRINNREMFMLNEVIKQPPTISFLIQDINYVTEKLNEFILKTWYSRRTDQKAQRD